MDIITVKMLQTPSVAVNGQTVFFSYKKVDALFYYLICRRKATRGELVDLLWDEMDSAVAYQNLRHAIYSLRQKLACDVLVSGQKGLLTLNPEVKIHCDLWDFLERDDLSAYQNEFLPGFAVRKAENFEEFLANQRSWLNERYLEKLKGKANSAKQAGDFSAAELYARQYLAADPLDEDMATFLMLLCREQKLYRKAAGVYHELCRSLTEELSIAPLKETTDLYYDIIKEWNAFTDEVEKEADNFLVGKREGLRCLNDAYNRLISGQSGGISVVIQGEAGVGKTCLLDYFFYNYDLSDSLLIRSACYQSEASFSLAPWYTVSITLTDLLQANNIELSPEYRKAVANLFPVLNYSYEDAESIYEHLNHSNLQTAQDGFMMALSALTSRIPVVLVFEDIHWMDKQSVELLKLLIRCLRNKKVMVVCTCREELPSYLVQFFFEAIQDDLLTTCVLNRLTREETTYFIQRQTEVKYSQEDLDRIYKNTSGNPLLLIQLLKAAEQEGGLSPLSSNPEQIINYRLAGLHPPMKQLLDIISLFSDWVSVDMLCMITGKDRAELLRLCAALKQQKMIRRCTQGGQIMVTLDHQVIGEVIYKRQPPFIRRVLHLRVVNILERERPETLAAFDRLIYHATEGGDRFKALYYKIRTLNLYTSMCYELLPILSNSPDDQVPEEENLTRFFSNLEQELDSLRCTKSADNQMKELSHIFLLAKGRFFIQKGLYDVGIPAIMSLVAECHVPEDTSCLLKAHRQIIYYTMQVYDLGLMEKHVNIGLKIAMDCGDQLELAIYRRLEGYLYMLQEKNDLAKDRLEQSITIFETLSDGDGRYDINIAGSHNYLGENWRLQGNYPAAYEEYEKAIALNQTNHYFPGTAVFFTNYGQAAYQNGDMKLARSQFEAALDIYKRSRENSWYPVTLGYCALFDTEDGRYEQAAMKIQDALGIAESINSPLWEGLVLLLTVRIRHMLQLQGKRVPCLEILWGEDIASTCRRALSLIPGQCHQWETEELLGYLSKYEIGHEKSADK